MTEIADSLRLLFETIVEDDGDRYVIEIPDALVDGESITVNDQYRIALLATEHADTDGEEASSTSHFASQAADVQSQSHSAPQRDQGPPVEEGEVRSVTIDTLGDQGDGIAKVERGFVVIVPDTEPGEQLDVRVTDVKDTVAFAEPV